MCDYEEFHFNCGHDIIRLQSYCHFARNDPNHQCFGVKRLRNIWEQGRDCDNCAQTQWEREQRRLQEQDTFRGFGKSSRLLTV